MKKRILSVLIMILITVMLFGAISASAYTFEYGVEMARLEEVVAQAEKFQFEHYNTSQLTWAVFQDKLAEAQELVNSVYYVSQEEIDLRYNDLQQAIENLGQSSYVEPDPTAVDKSTLGLLINEAESWKMKDYDVAKWEWANFLAEVEVAKAAYESDGKTQDDINYAAKVLSEAMDAMRMKKIGADNSNTDTDANTNTNTNTNTETSHISTFPSTETESVATDKPYVPQTEKPTQALPQLDDNIFEGGFIELGCGASAAISALAVVGIIGAALVIKKKRD